jgi:hypothetical protein
MRHILLLGLLLSFLAGAGAYQLAYKDPAGSVRWYRTEIAITGNYTVDKTREAIPMTGAITFVSREKVVAVKDDGSSTIVTKITDGELYMAIGDQEVTQSLVDYVAIFTREPTGKVSGMKAESAARNGQIKLQPLGFGSQWRLISGIGQGIEFPPRDIKAGAKWSQSHTLATVKTSMSNILRGPKTVEGATCLSIDSRTTIKIPGVTLHIPMDGQTVDVKQVVGVTAESVALFDVEKGELVGADFTGELKVTVTLPGADKPMTINGLLKLTGATSKIPEPAEPEKTDEAGDDEPVKE